MQRWFPDWTAAPAFYVDQGLIDVSHVYSGDELERGVRSGSASSRTQGADWYSSIRSKSPRAGGSSKTESDPKGLLSLDQIENLNALAESLGVRVMWAGGLTAPDAYRLGALGVFGIYVTTSVSEAGAGRRRLVADPALAAQKRPTRAGILKIKTLLEAGFLTTRLATQPQTPELRELRLRSPRREWTMRRWRTYCRTPGRPGGGPDRVRLRRMRTLGEALRKVETGDEVRIHRHRLRCRRRPGRRQPRQGGPRVLLLEAGGDGNNPTSLFKYEVPGSQRPHSIPSSAGPTGSTAAPTRPTARSSISTCPARASTIRAAHRSADRRPSTR